MDNKIYVARCGAKTKNVRVKVGGSKLPIIKDYFSELKITKNGCIGFDTKNIEDYNHYRTINKKLMGTMDRAVSIVTIDIYNILNKIIEEKNKHFTNIEIGSLGENLTLQNINYTDLERGKVIELNGVILEITEPCIPCFRLSTITSIEQEYGVDWWKKKNNTEISNFINTPGARGWYAKVLVEGNVKTML